MFWNEEDRICGNCAHWQEEAGIMIPNPGRTARCYVPELKAAPCAREGMGVDLCDAPGFGVVFMTADGHCQSYGNGWAPGAAFLRELREAEDARQADRLPWRGQLAAGL